MAQESEQVLRERVRARRAEVEAYLRRVERRRASLASVSFVSSLLAAVLTAVPAVGGARVTKSLTDLLNSPAPVWQYLCLAAAICSALAAFTAQALRSSNLSDSIMKAHQGELRLDHLELLLDLRQVSPSRGAELYQEAVSGLPAGA